MPREFALDRLGSIGDQTEEDHMHLFFSKNGDLLAGSGRGSLKRVKMKGNGRISKIDSLDGVPSGIQGILEAFDSLYVISKEKQGLIRCKDIDDNGRYELQETLLPLKINQRDGPYGLTTTEDGLGIYLFAGHGCPVPTRAKFPALRAQGGWIARITPDASRIDVFATGLNRAVQGVLNNHGDLFTCDGDAEDEFGLPWYRPGRLLHVISGADFGWRQGTERWPEHFADTMPSIARLGPTPLNSLVSGQKTNFPKEYKDSIFILSKHLGTIARMSLSLNDSGYAAKENLFLHGKGLHPTSATVGPDGSIYFASASPRGTCELFRIRHENPSLDSKKDEKENRFKVQRKRLETFHRSEPGEIAIRETFAGLRSPSFSVRHAARVSLERQPTEGWKELFERETNNRASITASLALARKAPGHRGAALAKLANLKFGSLLDENQLAYLRAFDLATRFKPEPPPELMEIIVPRLEESYPSGNDAIDWELSRVLAKNLEGESMKVFIDKTLMLLANRDQAKADQILEKKENDPPKSPVAKLFDGMKPDPFGVHLAFMVSQVETKHWTPSQKTELYKWLDQRSRNSPIGTKYRETIVRLAGSVYSALPNSTRGKVRRPVSP